MIKNDHTAFQVSDMDASIKFYTESLGLRLLSRKINPEEQEDFAFLELEGGNLELIQKLDRVYTKPRMEAPYCPHFAFETQDIAQVLEMVKKNGINLISGPLEIEGEEKWLYISDPDNNVIEFIEWIEKENGELRTYHAIGICPEEPAHNIHFVSSRD